MPNNTVNLSEDRHQMTILSPDGRQTANLWSALPDGFTDDQAFAALTYEFSKASEANQHTTAWRKRIVGRWYFYVVVGIGPPVWWCPRVQLCPLMMVGWLYGVAGVSIRKETDHE